VSDGLEDDVLALRNYSFISINIDGTTFEIHGLVQLATRKWLEALQQQERWKQQFIRNLCAALPTREHENWIRLQTLFPHTQSAAVQQPEAQDSLKGFNSIQGSIVRMENWERPRGGEDVGAGDERKAKILGPVDEDTLWSMVILGLAYYLQGQWDATEELFVQVMETRKKKLGANHLDTLININTLAFLLKGTGRKTEAVRLIEEYVKSQKRVLRLDNPHTILSGTDLDAWKAEQERQSKVSKISSLGKFFKSMIT